MLTMQPLPVFIASPLARGTGEQHLLTDDSLPAP